jgi:hypothetical protein
MGVWGCPLTYGVVVRVDGPTMLFAADVVPTAHESAAVQ